MSFVPPPPGSGDGESQPSPAASGTAYIAVEAPLPIAQLRDTSPPRRSPDEIRRIAEGLYLANDGDGNEQNFWPAISEHFPNYELFWRDLVVPMTKRIKLPLGQPGRHVRRAGVAEDLWLVSYINYSIFLNLVGAFEHLSQPLMLSLGNFYTHLASACDLAEDFLLRVHLLISECRGEAVPELALDTKEEFLKKLDAWYDRQYAKMYELYHKKGRDMIVRVGPRDEILCRYYERQNQAWKAYKRFSQPIREYRNKVVHDVQLANIRVGKINLMPRINKIGIYARMAAIQEALTKPEVIKRDFVVREEQMFSDFRTFKERLNALWEKPTADLCELLYEEKNPALMAKYNLA